MEYGISVQRYSLSIPQMRPKWIRIRDFPVGNKKSPQTPVFLVQIQTKSMTLSVAPRVSRLGAKRRRTRGSLRWTTVFLHPEFNWCSGTFRGNMGKPRETLPKKHNMGFLKSIHIMGHSSPMRSGSPFFSIVSDVTDSGGVST